MTSIESAAVIDEILGSSDWKDDLLARFAPGTRIVSAMSGGVAAAPMAPLLVNYLDARLLGVFVGGFVCFTNVRTLLRAAAFGAGPTYACYAALAAVVGLAAQRVAAGGARKEEKK